MQMRLHPSAGRAVIEQISYLFELRFFARPSSRSLFFQGTTCLCLQFMDAALKFKIRLLRFCLLFVFAVFGRPGFVLFGTKLRVGKSILFQLFTDVSVLPLLAHVLMSEKVAVTLAIDQDCLRLVACVKW